MSGYALTVNGRRRTVESPDPDLPLLWVLRDLLGLTGTKYGCGVGICGACTVHVDGKAMRSCQVPVSSLAGHAVTTIEGLSKDGAHPCQRAWLEEDVAQCGYCQPGMIMTCAAFFGGAGAPGSRPTQEGIEAALSEHVCRCGTYGRMRKAVARLVGAPGIVR
ncbi:MAG TPA: (2Fe-2S)-binding protein [Thermoanaerobaculia bacterium]|jgi:isoquinoline 1-oxidoreductase alpha subunit